MSALYDAVNAALAEEIAQRRASPGLLLTEFIVVAYATGWNDDGEQISQVVIIPDGNSPIHHMTGLLHDAITRFDAERLASYSDDFGDD